MLLKDIFYVLLEGSSYFSRVSNEGNCIRDSASSRLMVEKVSGHSINRNGFSSPKSRRPVVIWHGLGDNYNSSGINDIIESINSLYPGIDAYSVRLSEDSSKDKEKSYFGDANYYVDYACEEISKNKALSKGFDAIGCSQGGLFLRALLERCPHVQINNLITFGSPHMGVMDLSICEGDDWICRRRNEIIKKQVWYQGIQSSIIPAQYFRDPLQYEKYVQFSHFLADINNESHDHINLTYASKIESLGKLVLVEFLKDTVLVPKESAIFGELDTENGKIRSMEETQVYKRDLLGLRSLKERNRIKVYQVQDDHMRIPEKLLMEICQKFTGSFL